MNYIKHLTGFFDRIVEDQNLNPTHISLYIALFQYWNVNHFRNPISITRDEVMRISKICSKATYHKCMRELHAKEYLRYEPSFNPFKGSMVVLFNFSEDPKPVQKRATSSKKNLPIPEQVLYRQETSSASGTEQAMVSSINSINKTNSSNDLNDSEQSPNFENEDLTFQKEVTTKKNFVTSAVSSRAQSNDGKPTNEEVKIYFQQQNFPELEANKFFNYFSSNGWLVGGKTPMVNWQFAAKNWMLNAQKFNFNEYPSGAKHHNISYDKEYAEPL